MSENFWTVLVTAVVAVIPPTLLAIVALIVALRNGRKP
jgi:hypothetical protein